MTTRSSWWVACAVLAGLSCGASQSKGKLDLAVQSSPTGELDGPLTVTLEFSRAMVASEKIGDLAEPPLQIDPFVEGEATWSDDRTLIFVATTRLPRSTGYLATVPKGLKALDGHALAAAHSFEFSTEQLSADVAVRGPVDRATSEQAVELHFNQEVPFAEIEKHCVYLHDGLAIAPGPGGTVVDGPAKKFSVVPRRPLRLDSEWRFRCSESLRGTEGNLGLRDEVGQEFRTYGPLSFIDMTPSGNDVVPAEGKALKLQFTNPLAKPYQIELSPEVPGFPERCHALGDSPPGLSCAAMLDPRTSYTLDIARSQTDIFGQPLGQDKRIEFRTTDAKPTISVETGYFVAELGRPVLPLWTRNVKSIDVRAVQVTPENFHQMKEQLDWWDNDESDFADSELEPKSKKIAIDGTENQWGQHSFDPAALFAQRPGPGMYYIEIGTDEVDRYPYQGGGRAKTLVSFTNIGVVSKLSPTRGLVWTTSLDTGKPLPGAKVSVRNSAGKITWSGRSNARGVAFLPPTSKLRGDGEGGTEERHHSSGGPLNVFVSSGRDWTMVNATRSGGLASWNFNVSKDYSQSKVSLRGFMHTDRGLYQPGESVHIKGLARETTLGAPLKVPGSKKVQLEIEGPRGKTVSEHEVEMSRFGGFWLDLELPGDARLGDYTITARLQSGTFSRSFAVEEYRPATFEVTGSTSKQRVVRRGTIDASIAAKYLYGAPLREGEVELSVYSRPKRVTFRQHEGFDFIDQRRYDRYYHESSYGQQLVTESTLALDSKGEASLGVSVSPSDISKDADLLVRASVTSPTNEVINKTFTIPYFRSRRYFGIKTPGYFMEVGEPQKFEVLGVRANGRPIDGRARLTVKRRDWNCVWEDWGYRGSYQCRELKHTVLEKTLEMTGGTPASFSFTPEGGGDYWVIVEGEKDNQAAAAVELYAWGDGGGSWRSDDSMTFGIVTDKREYSAGDTATLVLRTDLARATGLVTIERDGIIEERIVEITEKMKHLTIPIEARHAPNVYVSVALVQGRMGEGRRGKPRMRMGMVNLPVRPEDNTLTVEVSTDKKDYRPGDPVKATVKVTDAGGSPVAAELAVTAADEGVLSLIGFKTPNPVPTFYSPWGLGVDTATQYAYIKDIPSPGLERPATGGDSGGPGSVRSRFLSTAVWRPGVVTNRRGIARVSFDAPDNLTAFRVMAVAADKGERFGSSDERFTVSKPLQLHRYLPRFLTRGDRLEGGVVVHNETGVAGTAKVRLEAHDGISIAGEAERTISLPAGGRIPVLYSMTAEALGAHTLRFSVSMHGEKDAVDLELPVRHASPVRVRHVAHGVATADKSISLAIPKNADPASVEVAVSVDPDGLAGIEDGLRDLIGYPYGCLEQTTSKVIPMLAVRGLAESLQIDGMSGAKLDGFVKAGIAKIGRHQTAYGGFSLWPGGEPEAYYTAYALWGLHLAKEAGYAVDQTRIADGLDYLRSDGKRAKTAAPYYNKSGHLGSQAFALHVRAMLGDADTQAAAKLRDELGDMPIFGKAFLARALAAGVGNDDPAVTALLDDLESLARVADEQSSLLEEPEKKELGYYMSSATRTTAIVLDTLVALRRESPAISGLVRVLMKERRSQRYHSTQANLYSLLALMEYARTVPGKAPSVDVLLGGDSLLRGKLQGKDRMRLARASIPGGGGQLTLEATGEVHYNVEIRYREKPGALRRESNGLAIEREYLDEQGAPKTSYRVGDVVLVRLTMPLKKRVSHLMVADHLPAGFEPLNTRFETVGHAGVKQSRGYWGAHREMHDDRVDFSSEYNWRGKYVREYMMRATAAGRFARPPAVAELMYEPETSGRTGLSYIEIVGK